MEKGKILGYILLFTGLALICYTAFNVFQVFTNQAAPFQLFTYDSLKVDLSKMVEGAPKNANLTQELISSDMLNRPMNLGAHLILMGFLASIGYKIASIGTMLIRTIKVNLKEQNIVQSSGSSNVPPWKK
jgi:hypothetical protein